MIEGETIFQLRFTRSKRDVQIIHDVDFGKWWLSRLLHRPRSAPLSIGCVRPQSRFQTRL